MAATGRSVAGSEEIRFESKVMKSTMLQLPFRIVGFHTDKGSEFVNKRVAWLPEKTALQTDNDITGRPARTSWQNPRTAPCSAVFIGSI